ncbi:sugar phosphate isomerase/epimerase family protein [Thermodesulfobacteriota bacterium]
MLKKSRYIEIGGTARSPEDVISLKNLGLKFAEIAPDNDEQFIRQIGRYNELRESLNIYYLAHGPREGDANDIENLEKVYLEKIKKILPLVEQLGIDLLTVHVWLDKRFINPDVIKFKFDLLQRIIDLASRRGITICIENLSEHVSDLGQIFVQLPDLKMTLDLGHAQLLTNENNSIGFIKSYPERINHIHMHDNRGGDSAMDDIHLAPGEGVIDFESIFNELKNIGYDRTITLELKPYEIENCQNYVETFIE